MENKTCDIANKEELLSEITEELDFFVKEKERGYKNIIKTIQNERNPVKKWSHIKDLCGNTDKTKSLGIKLFKSFYNECFLNDYTLDQQNYIIFRDNSNDVEILVSSFFSNEIIIRSSDIKLSSFDYELLLKHEEEIKSKIEYLSVIIDKYCELSLSSLRNEINSKFIKIVANKYKQERRYINMRCNIKIGYIIGYINIPIGLLFMVGKKTEILNEIIEANNYYKEKLITIQEQKHNAFLELQESYLESKKLLNIIENSKLISDFISFGCILKFGNLGDRYSYKDMLLKNANFKKLCDDYEKDFIEK